jgi:hypothetical protein
MTGNRIVDSDRLVQDISAALGWHATLSVFSRRAFGHVSSSAIKRFRGTLAGSDKAFRDQLRAYLDANPAIEQRPIVAAFVARYQI